MIKKINYLWIIVLITSVDTGCRKTEVIDLNADYLSVTDVRYFCSRECHEDLDLDGEPVKVWGHFAPKPYAAKFYFEYENRLTFDLMDIRTGKGVTIEISFNTPEIKSKLDSFKKDDKIFIHGIVGYGLQLPVNAYCSYHLIIRVIHLEDIKII